MKKLQIVLSVWLLLLGSAATAQIAYNTTVLALNNNKIHLRAVNDTFHGLQYRTTWGTYNIDGPALWGVSSGVLGTTSGGQRAALYWNNNGTGRVGIGTSAPDSALTVAQGLHATRGVRFSALPVSTSSSDLAVVVGTNGRLFKRNPTTLIQPLAGNSPTTGILWPADPGGGGADSAWLRYFVYEGDENTKLQIGTTNDAEDMITFFQAGEERMNIFNGNVGIGVARPDAKLDIAGNLRLADGTQGANKILVSDDNGYAHWEYFNPGSGIDGGGDAGYLGKFTAANTINNSGLFENGNRIGLGTTNPDSMLTITGGGLHASRGVRFSGLPASSAASDLVLVVDGSGQLRRRNTSIGDNLGTGVATTRIQPTAGNGSHGIIWPVNPGGGTGDTAWMRYYVKTGEQTRLQIGVGNEADDDISFFQHGAERMTIYNGNIGIATAAPTEKLHIVGKLRLVDGTQANGRLLTSDANGRASWGLTADEIKAGLQAQITALDAVVTPMAATVAGLVTTVGTLDGTVAGLVTDVETLDGTVGGLVTDVETLDGTVGDLEETVATLGDTVISVKATATQAKEIAEKTGWTSQMIGGTTHISPINSNSNVGIGTNPADAGNTGYKLAVNGNIRAKKIVVESGWADYVFDEKYNLMPLHQLAEYLQKNKHLPGIPKAAEIEKNGLDVAGVQVLMMQKIEELTLYMLEANRKTDALQKENNTLKLQLQAIQQQLNK